MQQPHRHAPSILPSAHSADAYLGRVDPRLRVVAAVALAVVIAAAHQFVVLGIALGATLVGLAMSGIAPGVILRRLLPLETLMLLLVALLPLSTPGAPWVEIGPLALSREGFLLGARIALKGNAIVLGLLALLGNMDATVLGHALSHLRVPDKLAHLLLFTVRYLDVLGRESARLRAAMKVRGFRPRMNLHTYRSLGYLVGMLLVRSFDRAERIMAAMKCRGFRGHFHLLDHFAFSPRRDLPFSVALLALAVVLLVLEWV
jgi:cobalt/nickel transport system permease protein